MCKGRIAETSVKTLLNSVDFTILKLALSNWGISILIAQRAAWRYIQPSEPENGARTGLLKAGLR